MKEMTYGESSSLDVRNFNEMDSAFILADNIVTKNYLSILEKGEVLPIPEGLDVLDVSQHTRLFRVKKIVYDRDENNLQKLINVYASMVGFDSNIVMIIDSDGREVKLYLGVTGALNTDSARISEEALYNNLKGNFPGSLGGKIDNDELENTELKSLVKNCTKDKYISVSCVSGVGSVREKDDVDNEKFIQGIEKMIDTMQGTSFSAIFIANALNNERLSDMRAEYELLYSKLVPFLKSELSFNESSSNGVTKTLSESLSSTLTHSKSSALSAGTTESTTHTEGRSLSHTDTVGVGVSIGKNSGTTTSVTKSTMKSVNGGVNAGIGIPGVANVGANIGVGIAKGVAHGVSKMIGMSISGSMNYSHSIARTKSWSDAASFGKTNTSTNTLGESEAKGTIHTTADGKSITETSGRGIQISYVNKSIQNLLDRIDEQLERLREGENYGIFATAAYFLAETSMASRIAASSYKGLINGNCTHVENSHINSWGLTPQDRRVEIIKGYLEKLQHPCFDFGGDNEVTPVSVVTGRELAVQMGLPRKSFPGLSVIETAAFGRNLLVNNSKGPKIRIGNLYHMGREEGDGKRTISVNLDLNSLTMHTFITGSTGSGKSNAIYSLLEKILKRNEEGEDAKKITFMVIEPAKGEYKDKFGYRRDVYVYGTNKKKTDLLRINPFSFPEEVHVLEHIDRLIEIFNVCWPMYAAMPAILKDAIERAYISAGWDLTQSECKFKEKYGNNLYPNFVDVLKMINMVMEESKYSSESKGDYTGALCTRVKSLTNGIYGQIFTNNELTSEQLFESNVIVDLSRVGSMETKSLLMGLLIMKMQEYRMSTHHENNAGLRHLTVLEEAHNLLKKTSIEQSAESSNLLGKSVEMLANSIAEMRTYGEGFIIADQAPGLLDMSVIRNTNTKIILRLPDISDRQLVGRAAALTDNQIIELSKLETGVAAVYQNDWLEPILCHITPCEEQEKTYQKMNWSDIGDENEIKKEIIEYIMLPAPEKLDVENNKLEKLEKKVLQLGIDTETKVTIIKYIREDDPMKIQGLRGKIIYSMFNSETAFVLSNAERNDIYSWCNIMLEKLEPNISIFDPVDQDKILTLITHEHAKRVQTSESNELMENLLGYVEKHR